MSVWTLEYDGFDPAQERLREALCTLGNGYVATRGAAPEARAGAVHAPGTYAAGCFDRLQTELAGRVVEDESIVNLPNWLVLRFRVEDGPWFDVEAVDLVEHQQTLDLRRGVLIRHLRFGDDAGRITSVTQRRFVHMGDRHLAGLETTFLAENWSGALTVVSGIDGDVRNDGVARYDGLANEHLVPLVARATDGVLLLRMETCQSRIEVSEAARTRVIRDGDEAPHARRTVEEERFVAHELGLELVQGEPLTVEKVVALHTSRDAAISESALAAVQRVERAPGFDALLASHSVAWDELWRRNRIVPEIAEQAAATLNLHLFHLLQTVSPHTAELDAGVPARGLHGEAYRGHVFWDELFVFPTLSLRFPELVRSLLGYRLRRLGEARFAARAAGFEGALFPWQSGSDGREETPTVHLNPRSGRWVPDNSRLQRHVNAAVAYNAWQYYQVTGDLDFLADGGAELIVEIARFFASAAHYDRPSDRYELRGVVGPDEYHDGYPGRAEPGIDNNAYTNVMAAWVLARALEVLEVLPPVDRQRLWEQLELRREELQRWDDVSRKLRLCFLDDGILAQFEGYDELEELDWDEYRRRYGDIHRLDRILEAEGDTANRYQVAKQADVLMLFYLFSAEALREVFERLGYALDPEAIPRTIEYYLERTSHGSTLSGVVHSWVLARSDRSRSWEFFLRALESDVADIQGGTTAEGIHLAAMAGTVDLLQRAYTGLELRGDVLVLNPLLPAELACLEFDVLYRGQWLTIRIADDRLTVRAQPGVAPPVRIGVRAQVHELEAGGELELAL